jgi:hypothetical protein
MVCWFIHGECTIAILGPVAKSSDSSCGRRRGGHAQIRDGNQVASIHIRRTPKKTFHSVVHLRYKRYLAVEPCCEVRDYRVCQLRRELEDLQPPTSSARAERGRMVRWLAGLRLLSLLWFDSLCLRARCGCYRSRIVPCRTPPYVNRPGAGLLLFDAQRTGRPGRAGASTPMAAQHSPEPQCWF